MWLEKKIDIYDACSSEEIAAATRAKGILDGALEGEKVWHPKKGDAYEMLSHTINEDSFSMAFPSTRFYGSKRRQLSWLHTELSKVPGRTALDAFGGTGAVSYLLGRLGFHTTYNDIFEFNTISAKAIFSKSAIGFNEAALRKLLDSVIPTEGFISSTFDGLYFTREENRWLDGIMLLLRSEREEIRNLVLHCLFQACLKKRPFNLFHRANLALRQSKVPVQFGNRTTWERPFSEHMLAAFAETLRVQWAFRDNVQVAPGTCAKKISGKYDLVYLDPPYFKKRKRNTDTYLQRYHFLEGLARYDEWPNLIDLKSPQRVLNGPYREEWSDKREMVSHIDEMIERHRGSTFALSYVSGEEPTEEELMELFLGRFRKVRLSRRSFNKVLSNKKSFEILLIGK